MIGLKNRCIVITGGASGIGAAAAIRFVQEGARVVIMDHDRATADQLVDQYPERMMALHVDVADHETVVQRFSQVKQDLGGIDVLINNAGISQRHAFIDITPSDWQHLWAVNMDGAFYCAQQAARQMLEMNKKGVILNTASVSGLVGMPGYADYNASKAALIELTRTMALELAPNIRVLAICPGYVLTPMQAAEYTPEAMAAVNATIPLKRHAKPEEIAALMAFLASDEAPFMTGTPVIIDGGETAGGLAS
ncbi:SDR family NAD(P)-dependent oxidoreductase [Magnetococcales bacterium HHB-1]